MNTVSDPISAPGRVKEITSLANPQIKEIRALFQKKQRDRQRAFLAEGQKLLIDALDQGWKIRTLVHAKSAADSAGAIAARTVAAGGNVLIVPEKVLGAITRRDNPQMIIGVLEQQLSQIDQVSLGAGDVWIALDRVRDPGNLGTIVRTADAAGAKGIILVGDCVDPFSPETVRATMGSIFSIPIARCDQYTLIDWSNRQNAMFVGTHLEGSVDYRSVDYAKQPVVLLMGNEQQGLSRELADICDTLVRIPQTGKADSLNLAVSTGVMLFEIRREALELPQKDRS